MTRARRLAALVAAASLTAVGAAAVGSGPSSATETRPSAADHPKLSLQAASSHVVLERYGHTVYPNFGIYAVAGDDAFEIRAHRESYHRPIEAELMTDSGAVPLPEGLVSRWGGLPRFVHLKMTDSSGAVVVDDTRTFCPTGDSVRVRPDAPDVSTYPYECSTNPFTVGAVYGIDPGFGIPVIEQYGRGMRLPLGRYTATVWVSKAYRQALGLRAADTNTTVSVRVVKGDSCIGFRRGCKATADSASRPGSSVIPRRPGRTHPDPAKALADPPLDVRPDLRSLPAFDIGINRHGYLEFAATVWNAGPSPLVVDGFRANQNLMHAYQYFYSADGTPQGYARAGGMEWDPRHGHHHWHFRDFARYRLLDEDKNLVVRSRKEAFCLANTDAVDYTVPGANWRPYNTDLYTSCGDYSSMAVREVLDTGSGDTYYQSVAGQSFNIADLDNGVYYIAVEANPAGRIYEADTSNDVTYRKIILGGKPDARTVRVPDVGLIHAP